MRGRLTGKFALPIAVAVCVACAAPAAAQAPPTTPVPQPNDPGQPPASVPHGAPHSQPVIGDAGTALGMVRLLPDLVKTDSIVEEPGFSDKLPRQALTEFGFGVATAQANSEAFLEQERSIAESKPVGAAVGGRSPATPADLFANAPPAGGPQTRNFGPPPSPGDQIAKVNGMQGSVQANWDAQRGPCVGTISDATTSLGSLSAVNGVPRLPANPQQLARGHGQLGEAASRLPEPLSRLGGLLNGQAPQSGGKGSLVSVPESMKARSTVRLVDSPGVAGKAVQSVSRVDGGGIRLFAGTPQEFRIDVASEPELTATHTGDPKTSSVDYKAPVLRISQGGRELGVLDIAHPEMNLPVGIPNPAQKAPRDMPLIGHPPDPNVLDIGVLKLSIGDLKQGKTAGQIGGGARLFDLQLLPTEALGIQHPSALAQVSLGEQVVRAQAPRGGVICGAPPAGSQPPAGHDTTTAQASGPTRELAQTGTYGTIPLFWAGTGLLLSGAILLAFLPRRSRERDLSGNRGNETT